MSDLEFTGRARLFPLPNLVFFPHVMLPLHIFEPRYRQMTADALADDRLITMVLPQPGWEKDYAGQPAVHSVACVGRIMAEQELDDGCYNILLRGLARIEINQEVPTSKLYRIAQAEILNEVSLTEVTLAAQWRNMLTAKLPTWFPKQAEAIAQLQKLVESDLELGALCDIIAFALPLDVEVKQQLLEELDVAARLRRLHDFLDSPPRKFPPEFSVN